LEPGLKLVSSTSHVMPRTERTEDLINESVGRRIRRRRRLMGMTQRELAAHLGVGFQQVQKYETSEGRVSAARLYRLADSLKVPVGYFFAGLAADGAEAPSPQNCRPEPDADLSCEREAEDLLIAYTRLPDSVRCSLRRFAKTLCSALPTPAGSKLKQM
jgi:transcriptional regulator with XRE-family HTH domain